MGKASLISKGLRSKSFSSKSFSSKSFTPPGGYAFIDPDASDYYDALVVANGGDIDSGTLYSVTLDALKAAMDGLYIGLKSNGAFGQMDYQYWFLGGTADTHAINGKTFASDLNYIGGPLQGAAGTTLNGSTQHIVSINNPSLENDPNSNHVLLLADPTTASFGMGSANGVTQAWYLRQNLVFREYVSLALNASGRIQTPTVANLGAVHIGSRISAVRSDLYENGVSIDSILTSAGSLPTSPTFIGALDFLGTPINFMQGPVKAATWGGGLTAAQALLASNIINGFNAFLGR